MEKIVTARCVGCGARQDFGPDDVVHGEQPMCKECGSPMLAETANFKPE